MPIRYFHAVSRHQAVDLGLQKHMLEEYKIRGTLTLQLKKLFKKNKINWKNLCLTLSLKMHLIRLLSNLKLDFL